jgi:GNAT superfamily N-acetyltransferase
LRRRNHDFEVVVKQSDDGILYACRSGAQFAGAKWRDSRERRQKDWAKPGAGEEKMARARNSCLRTNDRLNHNACVEMQVADFQRNDCRDLASLQASGWIGLEAAYTYYLDNSFCIARKIYDGARILAVGAAVLWPDSAWLGHVLVAVDQRRRGLGAAITRDLLAQAERRGITKFRLSASALGAPLYESLGFVARDRYLFFSPCRPCTSPVKLAIKTLSPAAIESARSLDFAASGDHRSAVLCGNVTRPKGVFDRSGHLRGFYQPGLFEGPVIARDSEAGLALLRYKHRIAQQRAVVPAGNESAVEFLKTISDGARGEQIYMTLGDAPERRPEHIFSRAAGFLG